MNVLKIRRSTSRMAQLSKGASGVSLLKETDELRELRDGSVNYLVYGNIHHLLGCLYSSFLHAAVYILFIPVSYLSRRTSRPPVLY